MSPLGTARTVRAPTCQLSLVLRPYARRVTRAGGFENCQPRRSPSSSASPDTPASRRRPLKEHRHLAAEATGRPLPARAHTTPNRYRMAPCNNCGMEPDVADLTLPEEDRQELIRCTVACVERLLPTFEADRPEDPRLSDALDGARHRRRTSLRPGRGSRSHGRPQPRDSALHEQSPPPQDAGSGTRMAAHTRASSVPRLRLR
jgi:hypothetical protein